MCTGLSEQTIFLRENALAPGKYHTMMAEGWTPGSTIAAANFTFYENQPPTGGSCSINPLSGRLHHPVIYYFRYKGFSHKIFTCDIHLGTYSSAYIRLPHASAKVTLFDTNAVLHQSHIKPNKYTCEYIKII